VGLGRVASGRGCQVIIPGDAVIIHGSAWDLAASVTIITFAFALLAIVVIGCVRHIWRVK
jgi:hypothetical protein